MPAAPPNPTWPVYAALALSVVGNIVAVVGWFVQHRLTKRRDAEKDKRLRDETVAKERSALEAALRLTDSEREILRQCVATEGFERGRVWILRVDAYGSWIRAGKHDFFDQKDSSVQARYMDAFESLFGRGYYRSEGRTLFHLTGAGFERAEHDA